MPPGLGDIVGIDIGASLDGYFADMARTLPVERSRMSPRLCK